VTILLCLAALYKVAFPHDLEDGEIFEGDILWDDNLKQFWDRSKTQKRSANPSGNDSQNSGNSSQNQSNSTTPQNYVWNFKTSDNDGSLTYTIPYVTTEMSELSIIAL
jgi:hypothetical protein